MLLRYYNASVCLPRKSPSSGSTFQARAWILVVYQLLIVIFCLKLCLWKVYGRIFTNIRRQPQSSGRSYFLLDINYIYYIFLTNFVIVINLIENSTLKSYFLNNALRITSKWAISPCIIDIWPLIETI